MTESVLQDVFDPLLENYIWSKYNVGFKFGIKLLISMVHLISGTNNINELFSILA